MKLQVHARGSMAQAGLRNPRSRLGSDWADNVYYVKLKVLDREAVRTGFETAPSRHGLIPSRPHRPQAASEHLLQSTSDEGDA